VDRGILRNSRRWEKKAITKVDLIYWIYFFEKFDLLD
jgi:hypothetical protein